MTDSIFFHIPKTGGRSIVLSHDLLSANGVIAGHVPCKYIERPCKLWTVARDPVDRIYSLFKFTWRTNGNFDMLLDYLETEPAQYKPRDLRDKIPVKEAGKIRANKREESLARWKKGEYEDSNEGNMLYSMDKLGHKWFEEKDTTGVGTLNKMYKIPGINLATQWAYIENDVGHDIEIVSFTDRKRIEKLAGGKLEHVNKGRYQPEEKVADLTPERIERIKHICRDDYNNIEVLKR